MRPQPTKIEFYASLLRKIIVALVAIQITGFIMSTLVIFASSGNSSTESLGMKLFVIFVMKVSVLTLLGVLVLIFLDLKRRRVSKIAYWFFALGIVLLITPYIYLRYFWPQT